LGRFLFDFLNVDHVDTCRTLLDKNDLEVSDQEVFIYCLIAMTSVFYREAIVAVIMYDVTNPETFEHTKFWKNDIDSKVFLPTLTENDADDIPIPCILIGNKIDLERHQKLSFKPNELDEYCEQHGFCGWVETSAKDRTNLEKAVKMIVEQVIKFHEKAVHQEIKPESSNTIDINKLVGDAAKNEDSSRDDSESKKKNTGCCGK